MLQNLQRGRALLVFNSYRMCFDMKDKKSRKMNWSRENSKPVNYIVDDDK